MKRNPFVPYRLVFGLLLLLTLVACERPVPREDTPQQPDVAQPTSVPIVIPTALPTAIPAGSATPEGGEGNVEETAPADGETPGDGSAPPDTPETPGDTAEKPTSYTVQAGDTLGQIAETFDVDFEDLVAANGITNVDRLDIGQVLVIPSEGFSPPEEPQPEQTVEPSGGEELTHTVVAGENLFRIGLVYGFTAEELASYNGIVDPTRIEIGQVLRIPPRN